MYSMHAAAGQPRAVDDPREQAHQHDADARGGDAEQQAVPERRAHGVQREARSGSCSSVKLSPPERRRRASAPRRRASVSNGQHHRQRAGRATQTAKSSQRSAPDVHHARPERLAGDGDVAAARRSAGGRGTASANMTANSETPIAAASGNARRVLRDELVHRRGDDVEAVGQPEHQRRRERAQHLGEHEDRRAEHARQRPAAA